MNSIPMDAPWLHKGLSEPELLDPWCAAAGLVDRTRAIGNLKSILEDGMPIDLLVQMVIRLRELLPATSDPDSALNNLQRFVRASRSPQALGALFERDLDALPTLIRIFSVSQYLADQLVNDPESFDLLRMTDGQSVSKEVLVDEICNEVQAAATESSTLRILRDFRHRETLRIAFGDFIGHMPVETITEQNSYLADSLCEAAYRAAWRMTVSRFGRPIDSKGELARFSILALGKLGGMELNYASDIDLMYVAETEGKTTGPRVVSNQEFFDRLAQQLTRYLTEVTPRGLVYRVDLRLRPHGMSGPIVNSVQSVLQYYDESGRTWERQAFIKARAIAGDLALGESFLHSLQPWIFRRYLTAADISGIRALKRRIEYGTKEAGTDDRNVKTGRGGIRDIEFVIQFLQLLNGADWEPIRIGNTLVAISRLEQVGCLTPSERTILEENYRFLRRVEHCLQIMYDHQTHVIPEDEAEQRKLAIRIGFSDQSDATALHQFRRVLAERTELNRRILDHLLHDAFGGESAISDETDLVLDPNPSPQRIETVLGKYSFRDSFGAYRLILELASEQVPFLSTRRCRHFLAAIAEKLLHEISKTPDPDSTLVNLARISESLGGKAVLWELFSFHPPSLALCIRLCATSPYLVEILTASPGMLDELMDSLMLDRLPTSEEIESWITELCDGAEDQELILHSFKNAMHLRIGARDVLGKEPLPLTHRALANTAEACLRQVIASEFQKLTQRLGVPVVGDGRQAELIVLALGKLGGSEPNYHSDLDVMFLFDDDGMTRGMFPHPRFQPTSNRHFFNQLAQKISQSINRLTSHGKLYDLDARLRPLGSSGTLAISLADFDEYFRSGQGQIWERQLLCKARVVWGSNEAADAAISLARKIVQTTPWTDVVAVEIYDMRKKMEVSASPSNLKRGQGGTVDVEFLVQLLQLKFSGEYPDILVPGTLEAIESLRRHQLLREDRSEVLSHGYGTLRRIESGLRLMNTAARHDLPTDPIALKKLAFLLGWRDGNEVSSVCEENREKIRKIFDDVFAEHLPHLESL